MSEKFEFADLIGKQITNATAEFGGTGKDDYVGFDIDDGSQVQITGALGTLLVLHGDLEQMLDREIVSATHLHTHTYVDYDHVHVNTFILTVVDKSFDGTLPVINGYHTLVVQYLDQTWDELTVERKA